MTDIFPHGSAGLSAADAVGENYGLQYSTRPGAFSCICLYTVVIRGVA